jgi:hypothetical protein
MAGNFYTPEASEFQANAEDATILGDPGLPKCGEIFKRL